MFFWNLVALQVLSINNDLIRKIDLKYLVDKMLQKHIITDDQKRSIVSDRMNCLGGDERMDKLLDILKDTVAVNGSIFTWFIEILDHHTVMSQGIAKKLKEKYDEVRQCLVYIISYFITVTEA